MMDTLLTWIAWAIAIGLAIVAALLAMNKSSGLKLLQHDASLLPQVLLVRYAGSAFLALIAAWIGAPKLLFAMLLTISLFAFGDAFIYRRAGRPHWMHLAAGIGTLFFAVLALFSMGGTS